MTKLSRFGETTLSKMDVLLVLAPMVERVERVQIEYVNDDINEIIEARIEAGLFSCDW